MSSNDKTQQPQARVIAITSGKGGVGKTNIVANMGYTLCKAGKRVLIFDADLGLGNMDVLLGLTPQYNLSHVIKGQKRLSEIIVNGPGQLKILPASSGIQELTKLTHSQKVDLFNELNLLLSDYDIVLIDTAAGISSNVLYFNASASEIMVVVTPEPTSITDAYALMKVLSVKYNEKHFR
jgi:flagellar biosynthesis protein FlhG